MDVIWAWLIWMGFTVALCAWAEFAAWIGAHFSRPTLHLLNQLSMRLPFALLEWGVIGFAAFLIVGFLFQKRKRFRQLLGRIAAFLLAACWAFSALWLPLYWVDAAPEIIVSQEQLIASSKQLIDQLNEAAPDFSLSPDDLPAKAIDFPFWMRKAGISGFFSFPTGEALISPELADCAAPFVAVHEAMHARGIAGEGAANIAAWRECMRRGGLYAHSARLWGLKYSMQVLQDRSPEAYRQLRQQMNPLTFQLFRSIGGGQRPLPHAGAQAAFAALGVEQPSGDYEILAAWLASQQ